MTRKSQDPQPDVKRLQEYQRALSAFSRTASEVLPPERLMQHVTAQVSRLTHVQRVKVLCYRPDQGDLLLVAGVGWKPGVVGRATLSADNASPPGRAMQTAAPVVIEDLPGDPEFRLSPLLRDHGIVSVVNVPIMIDSRTWGVLEVDSSEPRSFDEADVTFLATFANMLGMALLRIETERRSADAVAEHAREKAFAQLVMRELQHRTKNNFQTIISFLSLQRRHGGASTNRDAFASVMDRVHAIALAHDQLSFKDGASNVEFAGYLRALCGNIDPRREGLSVEVDAEPDVLLPLDRAVPAGLITNELVQNCLKYAFDEGGGTVRVTFATDPEQGQARLVVEDDGRGMGEAREGGLGLRLIRAFVDQIDGEVEHEPVGRGTRACVRFPLPL